MANQEQELEARLNALYQRSLKGDAEAFAQAGQLATNALKNVQQVKSRQAEELRQKLEQFLAQLQNAESAEGLKGQKDSSEVQKEELHRRVLTGDVGAVDRAALTSFGRGELELGGKKMKGLLGIVFQCCLLFIEEGTGGRTVHILAKPGELKKVESRGLFSKKTVLTRSNGPAATFTVDKKKSSVDEVKRLDNLGLGKGLGL